MLSKTKQNYKKIYAFPCHSKTSENKKQKIIKIKTTKKPYTQKKPSL